MALKDFNVYKSWPDRKAVEKNLKYIDNVSFNPNVKTAEDHYFYYY